ncbi:MAG: hypothetical protein V9G98_16970 [Candidatus Competibacter sp.]
MTGRGFLGTNASVLADLSLVLGIVVAVLLTIGMLLAVMRRYEAHRWVQTTAVTTQCRAGAFDHDRLVL